MTRVATPSLTQKMARLQQTTSSDDLSFRAMDRILARTFVRELLRRRSSQSANISGSQTYKPRMDMCDDTANSRIVAVLELPGLKQEDILVRIEENQLIVQGERRFRSLLQAHGSPNRANGNVASVASTAPTLPTGYATQEIKYGTFRRAIELPPGTQAEHVQASLSEGMLTISWPRYPPSETPASETPDADRLASSYEERPDIAVY